MDRRNFRNFMMKRSSIWTLSLCMTGIIVLGGIAAVDNSRRKEEMQAETEPDPSAMLEEQVSNYADEVNDTLFGAMNEEQAESGMAVDANADGLMAEAVTDSIPNGTDGMSAGDAAAADAASPAEGGASAGDTSDSVAMTDAVSSAAEGTSAGSTADGTAVLSVSDGTSDGDSSDDGASEVSSTNVISEQELIDAGVGFTEEQSLMWPSAGSILIDYSMDGSVYFPTLNQYKYNPALIISSDAGNQVLASAKGIVESVGIDEVTGTTLVLNIGNGYKLTYGQLKELAVAEGEVVEAGAVLGYVSEPTKYFCEEGSNLYFGMTQEDEAVDPVLYLD